MPQRDNNRLITWYLLIKDEWLPAQKHRLREWGSAVREEPRLIWETPQVRYSVYGAGGLVGLLLISWLVDLVIVPPPANAGPEATTANFHVACTNPDCRYHFMIERKFRFDDFPVECPRCEQETGERALRCRSPQCGGKYVAPTELDGLLRCSECGASLGTPM